MSPLIFHHLTTPLCQEAGQETHLREHGHHGVQVLLALLLQVSLLVCPGLQLEALLAVDILQEHIEVLGLIGNPRLSNGSYVFNYFLSGKRKES